MIRIEQYNSGDKLPELSDGIYFHSGEFFHVLEKSPGIKPVMFVAYDDREELGHMLVMLKRDMRIVPPGIFHWCSVYGDGVYSDKADVNDVLRLFMERLKKMLGFKYSFIEARNIADPRNTYRTFSRMGFAPRNDSRIYISLHSRAPEERLSRAYRTHIRRAMARGVTYHMATDAKEIEQGIKLLKRYYASKITRYFAPEKLLLGMLLDDNDQSPCARMFTVYNRDGKMIGCSICLQSGDRAYLLYHCGLRKSHHLLYPGIMSVWAAIKDTHERGVSHFEFVVSGVPLNRHIGYRNFLLNFGGKQISTLRWYRTRWSWINKLLRKIYF
ncbi:MAG: GNAT family N-acetyltransferase [Bacteroidaceae bacterium]|nr:GNAT family N-acetyltransferase [Bacteroidaceae bacterium]